MKNIIKVRLIYSSEYISEKEYLKKFFQFIGCLVIEQCIDFGLENLYPLELDDIIIALNFFEGKPLDLRWNERQFYLYFYLEDGLVCLRKKAPLLSLSDIQKENNCKRDTRRRALEILVEAIWEGDEINKEAIKNILECYIPKDGDDDLFLALEEKDAYLPFLDWEISYERRKSVNYARPWLPTPMMSLLLSEFTRMEKLLRYLSKGKLYSEENKEKESPYLFYALINVRQFMNYIQMIPERDMEGERFNPYELINFLDALYKLYPWFITAILLKANIYASNGDKYSDRTSAREYDSFLSIVGSDSPYYRFGIFEDEYAISTWKRVKGYRFLAEQAIKVSQIDGNYYLAYYYLAKYFEMNYEIVEDFKKADKFFIKAHYLIKKKDFMSTDYLALTYKEALYWYAGSTHRSFLHLQWKGEFSMRVCIQTAILATKSFQYSFLTETIYGEDERIYKEISSWHYTGEIVQLLYRMLKDWVKITKDSFSISVLRKALNEFGDDLPTYL